MSLSRPSAWEADESCFVSNKLQSQISDVNAQQALCTRRCGNTITTTTTMSLIRHQTILYLVAGPWCGSIAWPNRRPTDCIIIAWNKM
ncbi:hypothetical protein GUJ93_ZPchr0011g28708 [Zizania palustris]|uniref:Uncharacterized protein n=1 Tax=Zizania palustris TaxID=103762 RepID=A0A8J5WE89_ZIZPA|nr:hypothetical protein GUJ93_ZPchr0011g28708 [Zizania palustris]